MTVWIDVISLQRADREADTISGLTWADGSRSRASLHPRAFKITFTEPTPLDLGHENSIPLMCLRPLIHFHIQSSQAYYANEYLLYNAKRMTQNTITEYNILRRGQKIIRRI